MASDNLLPPDDQSLPLSGPRANGSYLGQVTPKAITQEIEDSYIDYAMSVIVARALPDVRDGLKPVQRRILYAMYADLALRPGSSYKKSARIVGEVLGKYHPHGNDAVYNAMARMVQDFSLRYPLVDGQGNFGSVDGDNPAAMRYTEARLAPLSALMLGDIDKDTVDWQPNFDDSLEEPTVLPSLVPNLLINGTNGIAVGMATNIPPFNLGEVVDALHYVSAQWERRHELQLDELLSLVRGPDFPAGGLILGTAGIRDAFAFGHGRIIVRSPAEIEPMPSGNRHRLVFASIPYLVNKAELIARIADLVRGGDRLRDISDMRDESDRRGIRVVLELKSGAVPERVLNQLYKHSDLQTSFSVNFRALVNGRPERLSLREALVRHLEHCIEVVTRRTRYLLQQVQDRAHILEGLLTAIDNIERVIHVIRTSDSAQVAGATLTAEFALSPRQVQAILDMPLRRLAGLERQKLNEERREVQARIAHYRALLADPQQIRAVIRDELAALKAKYADARRTQVLLGVHPELSDEDLVTKQDDLISIWRNSNVRRTLASDFAIQGRGGIGVISKSDREEAALDQVLFANSLDQVLCLSSIGKAYANKVYNLPVGSRTTRGITLRGAINLERADEKLDAFVRIPANATVRSLILVTRKGRIKRMRWSHFRRIMASGKRAIALLDDDRVAQAVLTDGASHVLLVTRHGKALRLDETRIRYQGTAASGVRGIALHAGDRVVGCAKIEDEDAVLVIYDRGKGKRVRARSFTAKGRGTQGNWIAPHRKRAELGAIAAVTVVGDASEIAVVSAHSMIVRIPSQELSVISRQAAGVKVMGLGTDDRVVGVASLPPTPSDARAAAAEPETECAETPESAPVAE